jgi:hypothetical protein
MVVSGFRTDGSGRISTGFVCGRTRFVQDLLAVSSRLPTPQAKHS